MPLMLPKPYLRRTWNTEVVWRNPHFCDMLMVNQLAGFGGFSSGGFGEPSTVKSQTLNTNAAALNDYTFRNIHSSLSAGGDQIRITVTAHSTLASHYDNIAVGIRDGSTSNTLAMPVELFFSGFANGVQIAGGGTAVSDWADFVFLSTDSLLSIFDHASANGTYRYVSAAPGCYFKSATASYNTTTLAGATTDAGTSPHVSLIEARSAI